jgi:hypothetical protein
VPRKKGDKALEVATAAVGVAKEVLAIVRAALTDWPMTARLCVIVVVVAATTCTAALVLR